MIFQSDNGNRIVAAVKNKILVEQELPAHIAFLLLELTNSGEALGRAVPMEISQIVMIPHNAHYAIPRLELAEDVAERLYLSNVIVHQVAREDNQVWLLRIDAVDDLLHHILMVAESAEMEVGDERDAVAFELWRNRRMSKRKLFRLYALIPQCETIEHKYETECSDKVRANGHATSKELLLLPYAPDEQQ